MLWDAPCLCLVKPIPTTQNVESLKLIGLPTSSASSCTWISFAPKDWKLQNFEASIPLNCWTFLKLCQVKLQIRWSSPTALFLRGFCWTTWAKRHQTKAFAKPVKDLADLACHSSGRKAFPLGARIKRAKTWRQTKQFCFWKHLQTLWSLLSVEMHHQWCYPSGIFGQTLSIQQFSPCSSWATKEFWSLGFLLVKNA